MSSQHPTPRHRRTAAASLVAGAVVTGLLSGVPASAAPGDDLARDPEPLTLADGRYVVVLADPAAAAYRGGDSRFRATAPRAGEAFDARSPAVRAYTDHLESTQRGVVASVGADLAASYTVAVNGFAAELSGEQATALSADRRVRLVTPDRRLEPATSASPRFLGLTGRRGAWRTQAGGARKAGSGTVVGIIDTGIWPESASFRGNPLGERPKGRWDVFRRGPNTFMDKADGTRFSGLCQTGEDFDLDDCTGKLISARAYTDVYDGWDETLRNDYSSPRDGNGHGTHVAGTAAGNHRVRARVEGRDFGRISGMAPAAKIAAYKVCFESTDDAQTGCYTSSAVDAIDDAVADGVDVINYSISGAQDSVVDAVEIAFEGAAEAGVFVAASAGNSGPEAGTVAHPSPWLTTVAASSHVAYENTVVLGDGTRLAGASISDRAVGPAPLVSSVDIPAPGQQASDAQLCAPDSLDAAAAGTIVVCLRGEYDRVAKSAEVARAGGIGMVLVNPVPSSLDADFHAVPTVHLSDTDGARVLAYTAAEGDDATARIRLGNLTPDATPMPQIAAFSSRGPSQANDADVLKPDITAPGVSVLAAVAPPSNEGRRFSLYSGTSMSSPHIAGLGAFLAAERPDWTPMQIKSAMMTTARDLLDASGRPVADPFAQGAGHVRPRRMFDPGLFLTADARDWRGFLTGQGYDTGVAAVAAQDLNQPSMAAGQVAQQVTFDRQVVSTRRGTWRVAVDVPGFEGEPSTAAIVASRRGDVEDLSVTFRHTDAPLGEFSSGFVTLTGPTTVRIPVALRPVGVAAPALVQGSGTDGSVEVPVTGGFTGDLAVEVTGLSRALSATDTLEVGDSHGWGCLPVGEGAKALRIDVDSAQDDADLDLTVYRANSDCTALTALVDFSATGAADESVTVADPAAGNYYAIVDGFADGADGDGLMDYRIDVYAVEADDALGGLAAVPNPVPLVVGEQTSFEATWAGLTPGGRYLGVLEYDGAVSPTYVKVDATG